MPKKRDQATIEDTICRGAWGSVKLLSLLGGLLVLCCSCATTQPTMSQEEMQAEWQSRFPEGLKAQLEVAAATSKAYHAIADTPIKELQTDEGAKRIGELVTDARDKYRHWKSYSEYGIPRPLNGSQNASQPFKRLDGGTLVVTSERLSFFSGSSYGGLITVTDYDGWIKTSRGKKIFSGPCFEAENWVMYEPFSDVAQGDRIADIPALIGKIKR